MPHTTSSLQTSTNFDSLIKDRHTTAQDLKINLNDFCTKYDIDADRCASELLSFAAAFLKFRVQLFQEGKNRVSSQDIGDLRDDYDDRMGDNEMIDQGHDYNFENNGEL